VDTGQREHDHRLVEALRRGDESAFASLVDSLGPTLLRIARLHVPDQASAEEVVQETWLAVLDGLDRFQGRSALRTWILAIAMNIAKTRGRRERRTLPFSFLAGRREEGRHEPAVHPDRFHPRGGERPGWWAAPPERWSSPEQRLESRELHNQRVLLHRARSKVRAELER